MRCGSRKSSQILVCGLCPKHALNVQLRPRGGGVTGMLVLFLIRLLMYCRRGGEGGFDRNAHVTRLLVKELPSQHKVVTRDLAPPPPPSPPHRHFQVIVAPCIDNRVIYATCNTMFAWCQLC